jgi:hypothetical protein
MLKIKLRLHVFKRNGEKMKTHYKSQQQKTTTYHWAKMENTAVNQISHPVTILKITEASSTS